MNFLKILSPKEKVGKWEKIYSEVKEALLKAKPQTKVHEQVISTIIQLMAQIEEIHATMGEVVDNRWIYRNYKISKAGLYYHTITKKNLPFNTQGRSRIYYPEDVAAWARKYHIELKENE